MIKTGDVVVSIFDYAVMLLSAPATPAQLLSGRADVTGHFLPGEFAVVLSTTRYNGNTMIFIANGECRGWLHAAVLKKIS